MCPELMYAICLRRRNGRVDLAKIVGHQLYPDRSSASKAFAVLALSTENYEVVELIVYAHQPNTLKQKLINLVFSMPDKADTTKDLDAVVQQVEDYINPNLTLTIGEWEEGFRSLGLNEDQVQHAISKLFY